MNVNEFKVGDKIRCVNPRAILPGDNRLLTEGEIYEVVATSGGVYERYVAVVDDTGAEGHFYAFRFVLADDEQEQEPYVPAEGDRVLVPGTVTSVCTRCPSGDPGHGNVLLDCGVEVDYDMEQPGSVIPAPAQVQVTETAPELVEVSDWKTPGTLVKVTDENGDESPVMRVVKVTELHGGTQYGVTFQHRDNERYTTVRITKDAADAIVVVEKAPEGWEPDTDSLSQYLITGILKVIAGSLPGGAR